MYNTVKEIVICMCVGSTSHNNALMHKYNSRLATYVHNIMTNRFIFIISKGIFSRFVYYAVWCFRFCLVYGGYK